jgi:CheY-like chemotaxis protein
MISTVAPHVTLLLVDDDIQQLGLRAQVLKTLGFNVLSTASPVEAMSMMARYRSASVDLAILDYHMPVMNGCQLADHLRVHYANLKIILHSAAIDIPENEMASIDAFVAKGNGMAPLLDTVRRLSAPRKYATEMIVPDACRAASGAR